MSDLVKQCVDGADRAVFSLARGVARADDKCWIFSGPEVPIFAQEWRAQKDSNL